MTFGTKNLEKQKTDKGGSVMKHFDEYKNESKIFLEKIFSISKQENKIIFT